MSEVQDVALRKSTKVKKVTICSLGIASFILVLIAFVTPYWLVSWPRIHTPLDRLGLWEFCMDGFVHRTDESVQSFFGCWWIFAPYYDPIRNMLTPPWFRFVQLFMTLSFMAGIVNIIGLMLYSLDCVQYPQRRSLLSKGLYFLNAAITCFLILANTIFAFKHNDPYWMPTPSLNWPSWSFGFSCLATFCNGFASIVLFNLQLRDAGLLKSADFNFPLSATVTSHLSHQQQQQQQQLLQQQQQQQQGMMDRRYDSKRSAGSTSSRMPLKVQEPSIDTTV